MLHSDVSNDYTLFQDLGLPDSYTNHALEIQKLDIKIKLKIFWGKNPPRFVHIK